MRVLVDTNVLIDYSKGHKGLLEEVVKEHEVGVCPVNIAEFLNDRSLGSAEAYRLAVKFIDSFSCYEIDGEVGEVAGEYMRKEQVGYLGDALVAGVCVKNYLLLVTRNQKHFVKVKKLKIYGVEGKRKGE